MKRLCASLIVAMLVAVLYAQTRINPGQIGPIIPSAAALVVPSASGQYAGSSWFGITGNTPVTAMSGAFPGEQGSLSTLNGPVTFSAGATIAYSCTTAPGNTYVWYFDGRAYWIVGPGCANVPGAPFSLNVKSCQAKGNGTTDDAAAIQSCMNLQATLQVPLYFPAGTYLIGKANGSTCAGVSITTTGNVVYYGDGSGLSIFNPTPACIGASTSMLTIQTTGNVYLHDFGIDSLNTTGTPFTGDDIIVGTTNTQANASKVDIDHLYVAHGQVVGLQLSCDSNVTVTNSTFYQNWWYGASPACALGGTSAPVYTTGFNFHGNTYTQNPIGLGFSFFLSGISVTGENFENSSLALVQVPHAYASISGITFNGAPNYGCTSGCGYPAVMNAIYGEGASNVDVGDVQVNDWSGVQGGVAFFGSNVQLPEVNPNPVMELPITNVSIHGVHANNVAGWPIWVQGQSDGPSPTGGSLVTVKGNTMLNSSTCGVFSNVNGYDWSDNYCDNIASNGLNVNAENGSILSNRFHNISTGSAGTYTALIISGNSASPSLNNYVSDNEFVEDSGNSLYSCVTDSMLAQGYASMTKSRGNRCAGATYSWLPIPAVPGIVIGTPLLTGTGTVTATSAGTFSGTDDTFNVIATTAGTPCIFKWNKNGGVYTTGVSMTGSAQTLADGITVTFSATTGCVVNDSWTWSATSGGQGWYAGDTIQNTSTVTGVPLAWTNQTAGAGAWLETGYLGNSGTVAVSSCGSGASFAAGTANQFVVQVGTGTITACTLTWSHAFSGAPLITGLTTTGSGVYVSVTSLSSSVLVLKFSAANDSQYVTVSTR